MTWVLNFKRTGICSGVITFAPFLTNSFIKAILTHVSNVVISSFYVILIVFSFPRLSSPPPSCYSYKLVLSKPWQDLHIGSLDLNFKYLTRLLHLSSGWRFHRDDCDLVTWKIFCVSYRILSFNRWTDTSQTSFVCLSSSFLWVKITALSCNLQSYINNQSFQQLGFLWYF